MKNCPNLESDKAWKAVRVAAVNQILLGIPASVAVNAVRNRLATGYHLPQQMPSVAIVVRDLAAFLVVVEVGFYYAHRY